MEITLCTRVVLQEVRMTDESQRQLEIYLQEYGKLKDEQNARIGYRDNLLYITLGLFGGILTFALGKEGNPYALLVLPWSSLILGWTYLVNDEKITAIGRYLRYTLVEKVTALTGNSDIESIFGWEIAHRSDRRRHRRKIEQLVIDELTFVVSGMTALAAFWGIAFSYPDALKNLPSGVTLPLQIPIPALGILSGVELVLLVWLGIEIYLYADLARGR
jgi:hypothetical protein